MEAPDIFSRKARRAVLARAGRFPQPDRWLVDRLCDDLEARLDVIVNPNFRSALVCGLPSPALIKRLYQVAATVVRAGPAPGGCDLVCDEDRLPLAASAFDLIIVAGALETVNDLPGALLHFRRALRPGGLFLAGMAGGGAMTGLRSARTRLAVGGETGRLHPQVDVRAAGDLLARAGFRLPVADVDHVQASYRTFSSLFRDYRANALTNCLVERHFMTRTELLAMEASWPRDEEGRLIETYGLIMMTGWAS